MLLLNMMFLEKIKKIILIIIVFCILFGFFSCNKRKKNSEDNNSQEKNLSITATFYPLYIMLMNITDNMADVDIHLMAPADTGCLHDYQLTIKDKKLIEQSSIIVVNGGGMEDFLEKSLSNKQNIIISASDNFPSFIKEENSEHINSHIWVSLDGAIYEVQNITKGLVALDPIRAEHYKHNADIYIQKLIQLKEKMHKELSPFKESNIITFHEAFPYFSSEFGFNIVGVIEREPGTEPTAQELIEVINLINTIKQEDKNIALFAEPQYSSSSAQIIAQETGLSVFELDPTVTGLLDKNAYIDAMLKNTEILVQALGTHN